MTASLEHELRKISSALETIAARLPEKTSTFAAAVEQGPYRTAARAVASAPHTSDSDDWDDHTRRIQAFVRDLQALCAAHGVWLEAIAPSVNTDKVAATLTLGYRGCMSIHSIQRASLK